MHAFILHSFLQIYLLDEEWLVFCERSPSSESVLLLVLSKRNSSSYSIDTLGMPSGDPTRAIRIRIESDAGS